MYLFDSGPIIACSTGIKENSAIAVIRLSGFSQIESLAEFFSIDLSSLKTRVATRAFLLNSGEKIDDIILTFFKAPNSFTGENLLELSVHGNRLNVLRIISLFIDKKIARLAHNGEFSYRAYRNKKLTFNQVEGLSAFLTASTPLMLNQGFSLIHGELFREYEALHDTFLRLKSAVELSIDFLDDVGPESANFEIRKWSSKLKEEVDSLKRRTLLSPESLLTPSVVIAGPPNAGKSTLFNMLLSEERAIVSPIPGTTRDYLTESIVINGTPFRLTDTAGMRDINEQIEGEGIERAKKLFVKGFYKIFLLQGTEIYKAEEFLFEIQSSDLFIVTHADLLKPESHARILKSYPNAILVSLLDGSIEPGEKCGSIEPLLTGPIGPELTALIRGAINIRYIEKTSENPILIERHREVIGQISERVDWSIKIIDEETDIAIVSSKINHIGAVIQELIGIITPDALLTSIFSNFCIGK